MPHSSSAACSKRFHVASSAVVCCLCRELERIDKLQQMLHHIVALLPVVLANEVEIESALVDCGCISFFFFFENILIGVRVATLTKQKQLKFLRQIMQCNHIQLIVMLLKHIQNKLFYWQRQPLQGTKNERTPKII